MVVVRNDVGNGGAVGKAAEAPDPQNCHGHREELCFDSRDERGKFEEPCNLQANLHTRSTLLRPEGVGLVDVVVFEEFKSNRRGIVGAGYYRAVQASPARRHGAGAAADAVTRDARDSGSYHLVWWLHWLVVVVVIILSRVQSISSLESRQAWTRPEPQIA